MCGAAQKSIFKIHSYEKQLEINFGRNGRKNWLKRRFARGSDSDLNTLFAQPWIFRQFFLGVEPKIDFHGGAVYDLARC